LVRLPSDSEREREIHRQLAHEKPLAWKKLYNNSRDCPTPPLFWFAKSGLISRTSNKAKFAEENQMKWRRWEERRIARGIRQESLRGAAPIMLLWECHPHGGNL
jgi:hypothetical protein